MLLKVAKDRYLAALKVGKVANLESINLISGSMHVAVRPESIMVDNIAFEMTPSFEWFEKNNTIQVKIGLGMKSKDVDKSDTQRSSFEIRGVYELIYKLAIEPPPKEIRDFFFESFSSLSALHHVWPYWREYMDSCIRRMALPYFQIPLLRIESIEKKKAEKKEVDVTPKKTAIASKQNKKQKTTKS